MFLVTSPECRAWCSWQNLNEQKREPGDMMRDRVRARVHLDFVAELCAEQTTNGRYFLHEHPAGASSWQEDSIKAVLAIDGVETTVCDQCQYGQAASDGAPVKSPRNG